MSCSAIQLTGSLAESARGVFDVFQSVLDRRHSADVAYQRQLQALQNAQAHAIRDFTSVVNEIGETRGGQDGPTLAIALPGDLTSRVREQAALVQRASSEQFNVYRDTVGLAESAAREWLTGSPLLPASRFEPDTVEVVMMSEGYEGGVDPDLLIKSIVDLVAEGPDGEVDEQMRDQLDEVLFNFRVPVFGSPPKDFARFGRLLGNTSYVGGFGSLILGQGVWVAAASVSMGIVLHIVSPGIDNLSRAVDVWSADKLNLPPESSD
ncbi:hypothetical protein HQO24_20000 [Rhodococcus fascians]|nr:hypothetical protein [Rhodococcus fascians]MBY4398764.1 hypothetical protein [Rhodococcus fascians]MBY4408132.1 hypothetical protein [Rhodococcus fascians]MBY4423355.1 hypothetical protein [Rhodococcus fascians]MBY4461123.1 hypothetical protein [Rhodococcus fascians]